MSRPMKDSGAEWIGEIPESWNLNKLKRIFQIKKTIANSLGYDVLSVTQKGLKRKNITSNEGQVSADYSKYQIVEPNDFVMNHMDLLTGWVDCSKMNGVTSPDYRVFRASNTLLVNNQYYKYIFQICYSNKIFYGLGQGVSHLGRWRLQTDKFLNFIIPIPPSKEQQRIADYLDEKCARIEAITADTKQSIIEFKSYKKALITESVTKGLNPDVKMKDSGIGWIGEIPEHCNLRKIRMVSSKIGSGKTPRGGASVYSDTGILFLRSQNVYDTGLYLEEATYISEEIDEAMRSTRVYPNDVLLNITGGSIGRSCVYPANSKQHANVNQHVCIIRPITNKITPQFLFYFLNSNAGQSAISYYQTGGNREGLNFEQIGNIRIPYYSIIEQQQIADYLDEKCAHIDSLIADKEKLITEFEDYKKALIYEYVTGKKEVE